MSQTVRCTRCGREAPALDAPPMIPARLAQEVQANVCADCWSEWEGMEVMVINELRLNFMDPASQGKLNQEMRRFLGLEGKAEDPSLPDKERYEAEQGGGSSGSES